MSTVLSLSPVQAFKAQRIFKRYCNQDGCITQKKWAELMAASGYRYNYVADYEARFGKWCWLQSLLGLCRSRKLDIDRVWNSLGLEPKELDKIYASMEKAVRYFQSFNKLALQAKLADETNEIKVAAGRLCMASLILGDELSIYPPRTCSETDLLEAKSHLKYVLTVNPASYVAHKLLCRVQYLLNDTKGSLLSAQRSLLLNYHQADLWDFGGCNAVVAGSISLGNWMLTYGMAVLKSFEAAMHYGEIMITLTCPHDAVRGYKLALQLARSPNEIDMANASLRRVLDSHPHCKDVMLQDFCTYTDWLRRHSSLLLRSYLNYN